jgi:hypothetical protein
MIISGHLSILQCVMFFFYWNMVGEAPTVVLVYSINVRKKTKCK